MTERTDLQAVGESSKEMWNEYWDIVTPHRDALWNYCRRITGSAWDAEDLFQDTLLKSFASLSALSHREQPLRTRPFLFRVATNRWIDQCRRMKVQIDDYDDSQHPGSIGGAEERLEVSEALEQLIRHLPIRQSVVLVLMDSFQFTARETAELLAITEGAVHAILHRARTKVRLLSTQWREGDVEATRVDQDHRNEPAIAEFLAAYNRKDFRAIADLLIEEATYSFVAMGSTEYGKATITKYSLNPDKGSKLTEDIFVHEEVLWGQPAIIFIRNTEQGSKLHDINTIEWENGKIARWKCYHFCREFMKAAATELGLSLSETTWG